MLTTQYVRNGMSSGRIEWAGGAVDAKRDIGFAKRDIGFAKRDIGFVFQEPTLMPWATVADNVWLPLKLVGVSRRAARDWIADRRFRHICAEFVVDPGHHDGSFYLGGGRRRGPATALCPRHSHIHGADGVAAS